MYSLPIRIRLKNFTSFTITACFLGAIINVFVSCKKEDSNSPEDFLLQSKLIGTWENTDYYYKKICFKDDNTFIDSTFNIFSSSNVAQLVEVVTANYLIKDDQLLLSDMKMAYSKTQYSGSVEIFKSVYEPLHNLTFEGDNLIIEPKVRLVSNLKSNSNIVGSWNTEKLVAIYDRELPNKYSGGVIKYFYDFKTDLQVDCLEKVNYKNSVETITQSTDYNFSNDKLIMVHWGFNANVTFSKNEMFWTSQARNYKKLQ